ncbi:lipopolysaccharide biosynthesis protein [Mucilaginibacter sp. PPCGB 2223]|uniref:lipopolysaccharide biosynthesis protein n=1 Tax=Mucilaginibacter sp. PPCGB 2223 TaxID=1886027 RepID=UPI001111D251|nr:lipid II flippase MurJ [Mucilaginibacter sp. PPCGB 2223]
MAKNQLFGRVLSSGMQAVAVQVLGSVFFYFVSVYISKNDFGLISWMNAVCVLLTTFLGFGLEQVVVRRVAASKQSDWAATAFFAHSIAGFIITLLLLLLLRNQQGIYRYLPWFFAAQGLAYLAVPLKQFLNAKERFTPYGIIALISNGGKIATAYLLQQNGMLNLNNIILVLTGFAGFELLCLFLYVALKTTWSFKLHFKAYTRLIKEASAQYISVIFDTSLSRMDWILMGFLASNAALADYSFAYRAFELARLPMLIIGPLILPRLARLMTGKLSAQNEQQINDFAGVELFLAALIPLVLNVLWVPLVGVFTHGRYGATNATGFLLLSLCVPVQLFINLLWSISFSAKKYRQITTITIVCALLNIGLNLVLIPVWGGVGAAVSFLLTTVLQGGMYYNLARKLINGVTLWPVFIFIAGAPAIYLFVSRINVHYVFQLVIAIGLYALLGILSRQLSRQKTEGFKQFLTQ